MFAALTFAVSAHAAQSEEKIYLAFGDSIAAGYGIDNKNETYPAIIAKKYGLSLQNCAVNGAKSADMLAAIVNTPAIKDASLVTISIGGNDLIDSSNIFLAYAVREKLCGMGLPQQTVENLIKDFKISGTFDGSAVNFETIEIDMENVFICLYSNLSAAVTLIRTSNPNAVVILQTLYNPYLENPEYNIFGLDVGVLINEYIEKINSVYYTIQSETGGNILIADVASGMNGKSEYFYTSWDFHPTAAGHAYMAEIIGEVYGKGSQTSALPETNVSNAETSAPQTSEKKTESEHSEVQTLEASPAIEPITDVKDRTTLPVAISVAIVVVICVCALVMIKKNK